LYLQGHYHGYVSPTTIHKLFHRHHVDSMSKMKYRPGLKPADVPLSVSGRSVQLDVRFVPRIGRARQRFYQFAAIDEAPCFRALRIYDHNNTTTAIQFLDEVRKHFLFAIQKIQTGNDSSFDPQFTRHLSNLSISHRHIPPGCPEVNGEVERNHKMDAEEFYRGKWTHKKRDLTPKLKCWETEYSEHGPQLALKGRTPVARVRELVQSSNL
jgi:transposase InsO family protein